MSPKQFHLWGGLVLLVLGVLGLVSVLGPTAEASVFGASYWADNTQAWVHVVLGVVALVGSMVLPMDVQKWVASLLGVVFVAAAVYTFFGTDLWGMHLEMPGETVVYAVVGLWALGAAFMGKGEGSMMG